MKICKVLYSVFFVLLVNGCGHSMNSAKIHNYHDKVNPPNCIRISENFFCDKTEVSNLSWREYVYWNASVFGENSMEFHASLPDTLVWRHEYQYGEPFHVNYFRFPAYNYYPVVGVTQEQARAYSKWRSDRVFEVLLVRLGIISWNLNPTPETCFTIERFFNGEIKKNKDDTSVRYYPHFRLPTVEESEWLLNRYDSINRDFFTDYVRVCEKYFNESEKYYDKTITRWIYSDCVPRRNKSIIFNIRGNVSEWNEESGLASGGSWKDEKYRIVITDTIVDKANSTVGFRNVFEWKEWKN